MRTLLIATASAALFLATPASVLRGEDAPKVAVVHFSKLTPFLPDVAGWEAEKVQGNTLDTPAMKMTTVERRYTKGDNSAILTIMDYSESKDALTGLTALWAISNETTEGYQKGITIDGNKGWETYENAGKKGEIFLVVAGRFMVSIHLEGLPATELQTWVKSLNLKKLAEVK